MGSNSPLSEVFISDAVMILVMMIIFFSVRVKVVDPSITVLPLPLPPFNGFIAMLSHALAAWSAAGAPKEKETGTQIEQWGWRVGAAGIMGPAPKHTCSGI